MGGPYRAERTGEAPTSVDRGVPCETRLPKSRAYQWCSNYTDGTWHLWISHECSCHPIEDGFENGENPYRCSNPAKECKAATTTGTDRSQIRWRLHERQQAA